jgi:hypothetical protein
LLSQKSDNFIHSILGNFESAEENLFGLNKDILADNEDVRCKDFPDKVST